MHNKQESHFCRICGKKQDEPIWGEDSESPTFDVCALMEFLGINESADDK